MCVELCLLILELLAMSHTDLQTNPCFLGHAGLLEENAGARLGSGWPSPPQPPHCIVVIPWC